MFLHLRLKEGLPHLLFHLTALTSVILTAHLHFLIFDGLSSNEVCLSLDWQQSIC
jgi:hypothetical protein